MKKLPRFLQFVWMIVGAICLFEAYMGMITPQSDKNAVYIFIGIAIFAFFRYFILRRKQFINHKKDGRFDK